MAEKMTSKGLVIGLIVDQKETKKGKGKPSKPKGEETKPKGEETKPTNESYEQNDSSELAEKTEE